jgi:hypothetical protein
VFSQGRRLFIVDPSQTFPVNYTNAFERFFSGMQQPWYKQLAPRIQVYRFWAQSLTNGFEASVGTLLKVMRDNGVKLPADVQWMGERAEYDLSMYCGGFAAFLAAWLLDFMRYMKNSNNIIKGPAKPKTEGVQMELASLEAAAQTMFKTRNPIALNACMRKWLTSLEPIIVKTST